MSTPGSGTSTPKYQKPLKILMLHGYTQSGPLFRSKTRALEKNLQKSFPAVQLHYPTAPIRLYKSDIPNWDDPNGVTSASNPDTAEGEEVDESVEAYGWWRRKGDKEPFYYEGMDRGFARLAEVLQNEGPFDGVIGFSQGGALAGMLASVLEPDRRAAFESAYPSGGMQFPQSFVSDTGFIEELIHPPLKFAVSYSGFGASTNDLYKAFYEPKIRTPMLHFLGSVDTVVEEMRSLRLVHACVGLGEDMELRATRVVYHPGGHFLPSSQRQYVGALVNFIKGVVQEQEDLKKTPLEESVEHMDVPF
jgi:Serine hydrolase (FSH1)